MQSLTQEEKKVFLDCSNERLLALTIYGEARGESSLGKAAVACVIMNRKDKGLARTVAEVVLKPYQFSCFLKGDPNLEILKKLAIEENTTDKVFKECINIAVMVYERRLKDLTGGALNYFNPKIVQPSWAKKMTYLLTIGNHDFYK